MSTLASIPDPITPGASKFGSTFVRTFRECPFKWWLTFWAPHPSSPNALGLVNPVLGKPLAIGQFTHIGLAEYHLDGCRITTGAEAIFQALRDYEGPMMEDQGEVENESLFLLTQYDSFWAGDHPEIVYVDGHPVVERNLVVTMGYRDYTYTARLDALVNWRGHNCVFEHKTVDTGRFGSLVASAPIDIQIVGQKFLAHHLLPDLKVDRILLNCLIKRRAAGKDPCAREDIYIPDPIIEKFRLDITRTLAQIDEATVLWKELGEAGMEPYEAGRQAFSQHGSKDCSWCQFKEICLDPTHANRYANIFLPRASSGGSTRTTNGGANNE